LKIALEPLVSRFQLVQRVTLLVLCAQRFSPKSALSRLSRDVVVIIAKMVFKTHSNGELWKSCVNREALKLQTKKSKCLVQ
jgi:hypothetical protein